MEIPQELNDLLNQISGLQGIPIEGLTKYTLKNLNDPACVLAFPKEEDRVNYVTNLIGTFIQEFHAAVLTEYEIVVIVSSNPKASKAGKINNNHIVMAKLVGGDALAPPKWMDIENYQETGKVEKYEALSTGIIKVNIKSENNVQIDAQSTSTTEFTPKQLSWVPTTLPEKKEWLKKAVKRFTVATAAANLSAKNADGKWVNKCSLRWIEGNIATHFITKKLDETTNIERATGIISIVDKSCLLIPDFGKSKQVPNPKKPGELMTEYNNFSAFVDPEDIELIGKGSECVFIGTVTSGKSMNIGTILPIRAVPPLKPTDKLNKPGTPPVVPPAGAIDASAVSPASL